MRVKLGWHIVGCGPDAVPFNAPVRHGGWSACPELFHPAPIRTAAATRHVAATALLSILFATPLPLSTTNPLHNRVDRVPRMWYVYVYLARSALHPTWVHDFERSRPPLFTSWVRVRSPIVLNIICLSVIDTEYFLDFLYFKNTHNS